jgi:predicted acylesterase/phospholipase RssA
MKKVGLALSGGGFRASLYHLGLIRFLRDAGILSQVTNITSVSGGSIFSAHLVLNWQRYNGTEEEFESVAAEFLDFVRLNVRSRIVRRFPLAMPVHWLRRLIGKPNRQLTRTGLLEYHYEKYLFGDVSLFELPATPRLHLLTTNLSEGCLCSFSRDGLLMVRRQPGGAFRVDHFKTGLATVPMAVTASSAFPGFFPPLELTAAEVGVSGGELGKQAYTDGGVYDNLGVRMFRFMDRQILADDNLSTDDFHDLPAVLEALQAALNSKEETPLHRLMQVLQDASHSSDDTPIHRLALVLEEAIGRPRQPPTGVSPEDAPQDASAQQSSTGQFLSRLRDVMGHYQFQHEPLFADLKPADPTANEFLRTSRIGAPSLELADQLWLNRHLLEAAFRKATGQSCFRRMNSGLDCVIVSDVGRQIKTLQTYGGGLIRTAMRASDILMDRVWQLESETFKDSGNFIFARITDIVEPDEDPTAPHPELQRQAASIRTDLDRFSPLEISSLVRHGYCIGRKVCLSRPDIFSGDLPKGAPWEPIPERRQSPVEDALAKNGPRHVKATDTTTEARELQKSAGRRIWTSLFDVRDWVTYIYVPILVPILLFLPYLSIHYYKRSVRLNALTQSFAQGSPDLAKLGDMLDNDPLPPWKGVTSEEGNEAETRDMSGFKILSDSRITDLRAWNAATVGKIDSTSRIYTYRRILVVRDPDHAASSLFSARLILSGSVGEVRFPPQQLQGRVTKTALKDGEKYRWEALFDFAKVPLGKSVELFIEVQSPGLFLQGTESGTGLTFLIDAETAEINQWVLMPKDHDYKQYRYTFYKRNQPETAKDGTFTTQYLSADSSILAFKLLSLEPGYDHDVYWDYK